MSELKAPAAGRRQLLLDFGHPLAPGPEYFVRGTCNGAALDLLMRWPDWPQTAVVLVAPQGAGKSHLARLLAAQAGATVVRVPELTLDLADRIDCALLVVEDADRGRLDEAALFHLLNRLGEAGGNVLITARRRPAAWGVALADLASRLRAAGLVEIGAPDERLLGAVLAKQFADRQIEVSKPVLDYTLARMDRSFAGAQALVEAIDIQSLEERRAITVPLVARVLAGADMGIGDVGIGDAGVGDEHVHETGEQ